MNNDLCGFHINTVYILITALCLIYTCVHSNSCPMQSQKCNTRVCHYVTFAPSYFWMNSCSFCYPASWVKNESQGKNYFMCFCVCFIPIWSPALTYQFSAPSEKLATDDPAVLAPCVDRAFYLHNTISIDNKVHSIQFSNIHSNHAVCFIGRSFTFKCIILLFSTGHIHSNDFKQALIKRFLLDGHLWSWQIFHNYLHEMNISYAYHKGCLGEALA